MKFNVRALGRAVLFHSFTSTLLQVFAQTPVNGQTHSRGLAIINAPAPNSEHNAPGTLPISIEVSGNGRIPFDGLLPESGLPTSYEELNIFLVSSQTDTNLTVSIGPQLLTDETGTVRHLNWQIPSCIRPGRYNMTFYEKSNFDGDFVYAITPIPISIRNPSPGEDCPGIQNALEDQPQADLALPEPPFIPADIAPTIYTFTMSEGQPVPTRTGDPSEMTTITAVVEQPTVFSENGNMKTSTTTFTTTMAMRTQDLSSFFPVNAAESDGSSGSAPFDVKNTLIIATLTVASFFF